MTSNSAWKVSGGCTSILIGMKQGLCVLSWETLGTEEDSQVVNDLHPIHPFILPRSPKVNSPLFVTFHPALRAYVRASGSARSRAWSVCTVTCDKARCCVFLAARNSFGDLKVLRKAARRTSWFVDLKTNKKTDDQTTTIANKCNNQGELCTKK